MNLKYPLFIFFVSCVFLVINSCGESKDETKSSSSSSGTFSGNNNNSVLTGNSIGSGETSNSQLSKSVTLTLQTSHSDITLGTPYVGRSYSSGESINWIIPVTNNSSTNYHCFINLRNIRFYDSYNQLLSTATPSFSYVNGSVGKTNDIYSSTCLSSNEKGFFSSIELDCSKYVVTNCIENIYTNLSKIVIESIYSDTSGFSDPEMKVLPHSYGIEYGKYNNPYIWVQGYTNFDTTITFSYIYLIDSKNHPIYFSLQRFSSNPFNIFSSSSDKYSDEINYNGSISKIHVFLNLVKYSSSSQNMRLTGNCKGTQVEKQKCYIHLRNQNIEQMRMKLN